MGWAHANMGDTKKAIKFFKRALAIADETQNLQAEGASV
jgi:hypothetical protein